MRKLYLTLSAVLFSVVSFAVVGPITGSSTLCVGLTAGVADTTAGGVWSVSDITVATISSGGLLTGVSAGVDVVSYTVGSTVVTMSLTVAPMPAAISGPSDVCDGASAVVTDPTTGGIWATTDPSVLYVSPVGTITGVSTGVSTVEYALPTGCSVSLVVTVLPTPAAIVGPSILCPGGTDTLTDGVSGGVWSSTSPAILSVGAGGVITATSAGVATIAYTIASGCSATHIVTVTPAPTVYTVSGGGAYCAGGTGVYIMLSGSDAFTTYQLFLAGTAVHAPVPGVGSSIAFGPVTAAGTYTIVASATSGASGCISGMVGSASVVVDPAPTAFNVTGGGYYCAGGSGVDVALVNSTVGVNYQLYNGSIPVGAAIAGTSSALDFGHQTAPGVYKVVAENVTTACVATMYDSAVVGVYPLPTAYIVGGGGSYCAGSSGADITLGTSDTGVTYQLYLGTTAVGLALTGTGGMLDFGYHTYVGSYSIVATGRGGCTTAMTGAATVAVNPLPNIYVMTGGGTYCSGGSGVHIGLASSDAGINYQLYVGGSATGTALAGTGSTLDMGVATTAGTYFIVATNAVTGCSDTMSGTATVAITTATTPTISISASPGTAVCAGTPVTFTQTATGGGSSPTFDWDVNGTAAAVGSSYTYIPVDGDVVSVTMTSSASCVSPTTVTASVTVTVYSPTVTASATAALCGDSYNMSASGASSYTWSPATGLSCTGCSTPTCSGLSASVTYSVTGVDGHGCVAAPSTVTANFNRIYGSIYYTGGSSSDVFRVWLIQYNPSDSSITATDSTNTCMDSGIPYYEFSSPAAGNYMVKAKLDGTVPGSSGYMPTYSYSSSYWYLANTDAHTTSADTMNINMIYGTVPTGPGFISGYVYSGAGRGTSGDVPAVGMTIYLKDATTGHVITYMETDGTGYYAFSGIANGTYIIYPESYSYYTTTWPSITLSSGSESVTNIDFKQHTTSGTITPLTITSTGVQQAAAKTFEVYPNPTNGVVNISWANGAVGNAVIELTDLAGRVVYHAAADMSAASGSVQVPAGDLQDGIYLLNITSSSMNYTGKVSVLH